MPVAAHLAFSSLGFNPTDDGFILAMSRRLLEGEVPHRDFISIRPVGSALLHLPEVWLGGAITLWLGRLVAWCEFAVIAFCWVDLAARLTREPLARLDRFLRGVVAFTLSAHTFPIMPWHTVDAVALVSAGAWQVARRGAVPSVAGFALIGAAGLCRQNFLLLPVIAILCTGHGRAWRAWLAGLAPALLYAAVLAAFGGLSDARLQLTTRVDVWQWGVAPYLRSAHLWGGAVLGLALAAFAGSRPAGRARDPFPARHALGLVALAAAVVWAASTMLRPDTTYIFQASFLMVGVCAGQLAALALPGARGAGRATLLALALATAWSASVSIGYGSPSLAAGALFAAAFHVAGLPPGAAAGHGRVRTATRWVAIPLALALVAIWVPARLDRIYRERPAAELDRPLGEVLPGGALIRTNRHTWEFLADLQLAARSAGDLEVAVVPDCAAYWIRSRQRNPLPLDWLLHLEMGRPELIERVGASLSPERRGRRLLVQKASAIALAQGFVPLPSTNRMVPVVGFVRATHRKVGETRWFEIYE